MAEVSSENIVPVSMEEADYTLDNITTEGFPGDDYDFDLGVETVLDPATEPEAPEVLEASSHAALAGDEDEISYEGGGAPVGYENGNEEEHVSEEVKQEDDDEIGYEDVDAHADHTMEFEGQEQDAHQGAHDSSDFGFEAGEATPKPEHVNGTDEDEERRSEEESVKVEDVEVEDEDEADDALEENGLEEIDVSLHDPDDLESQKLHDGEEDDVEDDDEGEDDGGDEDDGEEYGHEGTGEMESPGSLNTGLHQLHSSQSESAAEVTVTWGNDTCPLFKTSDVDSPDSFFLEDRQVLSYPLSKFLQTIRKGIASWVRAEDEIFIRIDDFGFEFGETTAEALLDQVTFLNLIALHNTLLANDDATLSKGLHITLGTRPNCLLRLKELVSAAGSGKGLSSFQTTTDSDASSYEEDDVNRSEESSPDHEMLEDAEEERDASTPEADMADADVVAGDTDAFGEEADAPTAPEEAEHDGHDDSVEAERVHVAQEVDFIDFTNEEEDAGGAPLEEADDVAHQEDAARHADNVVLAEAEQEETDLVGELETLDHQDDLYLFEDQGHAGGGLDQEQDEHTLAHLDPDNGLEAIDHDHRYDGHEAPDEQPHNDDDFLDLSGDVDEIPAPAELPIEEAAHTLAVDDTETALEASVTATLDHDEIDYEDQEASGSVGPGSGEGVEVSTVVSAPGDHVQPEEMATHDAVLDPELDEIDWEDKNGAPSEAALTPATATGKRTRQEGGVEDSLDGELPDLKRHRTEHSPA